MRNDLRYALRGLRKIAFVHGGGGAYVDDGNWANVVVFAVIVLTVIPVMVAQRLTGEAGTLHK